MKKTVILDLGGSTLMTDSGDIDTDFLKKFRKFILRLIRNGYKFIIIVGGGKTARRYQKAARKITKMPQKEIDLIGIRATKLNAQFVKAIFGNKANSVVLETPYQPLESNESIVIASGWQPGWSTDYVSVLFAKRFGVNTVISATDIYFVFTKDFRKYGGVKPIKKIPWRSYQKLISNTWEPGMSVPVDPIAAREAKKSNIKMFMLKGRDLKNLECAIKGLAFKGTIIANDIENSKNI